MSLLEQFIILSFGLWRLVSLLANEDGPFNLFKGIRGAMWDLNNKFQTFHDFKLFGGYTCEWCLSLWLGFPLILGWLYNGEATVQLMMLPALSTVVIILKYVVQTLEQVQEYVHKLNKE